MKFQHIALEYFAQLNQIPRGSGNTAATSNWIVSFAKEHQLEYMMDALGNVVIKKPATKGGEAAPTVMLQGHLDMVCEKTTASLHNFEQDAIEVLSDGTYLYAKDTTLGADDGIAVGYMLALLSDTEHILPALECVFTVDEEIGLLGAEGLTDYGSHAKYLINLDNEEEHHICTSCAGGLRIDLSKKLSVEDRADLTYCEITLEGLLGGHSGTEIIRERANASLVMNRILYAILDAMDSVGKPCYLASFFSGTKDNAIPCNAKAIIALQDTKEAVEALALQEFYTIQHEYSGIEKQMNCTVSLTEPCPVASMEDTRSFLFLMSQLPNGVRNMEHNVTFPLVSTSDNIGIVAFSSDDGTACVSISVRSNMESKKYALALEIERLGAYLSYETKRHGDYPGWEFNKASTLQEIVEKVHREYYHTEPIWEALHAGLECGCFAKTFNGIDILSLGPDLFDVHTVKERMGIDSAIRTYEFVLGILFEIVRRGC